jgi:hypothetical protein
MLTAFLIGVWVQVYDVLHRRRLRRIAAGLPGIQERLGWVAVRCWHAITH